jgi:hypothetical protein
MYRFHHFFRSHRILIAEIPIAEAVGPFCHRVKKWSYQSEPILW